MGQVQSKDERIASLEKQLSDRDAEKNRQRSAQQEALARLQSEYEGYKRRETESKNEMISKMQSQQKQEIEKVRVEHVKIKAEKSAMQQSHADALQTAKEE